MSLHSSPVGIGRIRIVANPAVGSPLHGGLQSAHVRNQTSLSRLRTDECSTRIRASRRSNETTAQARSTSATAKEDFPFGGQDRELPDWLVLGKRGDGLTAKHERGMTMS